MPISFVRVTLKEQLGKGSKAGGPIFRAEHIGVSYLSAKVAVFVNCMCLDMLGRNGNNSISMSLAASHSCRSHNLRVFSWPSWRILTGNSHGGEFGSISESTSLQHPFKRPGSYHSHVSQVHVRCQVKIPVILWRFVMLRLQEIIWWCMMVAQCVAQSWMGRPSSSWFALDLDQLSPRKQIYFVTHRCKQSLCNQTKWLKMTSSYPPQDYKETSEPFGKGAKVDPHVSVTRSGFGQQPRHCTASGARWCLSAGRCAASPCQGGKVMGSAEHKIAASCGTPLSFRFLQCFKQAKWMTGLCNWMLQSHHDCHAVFMLFSCCPCRWPWSFGFFCGDSSVIVSSLGRWGWKLLETRQEWVKHLSKLDLRLRNIDDISAWVFMSHLPWGMKQPGWHDCHCSCHVWPPALCICSCFATQQTLEPWIERWQFHRMLWMMFNFFKLKQQVITYSSVGHLHWCWSSTACQDRLGSGQKSPVGHVYNGFLPKNSDDCSSELRHELVHFCTGLHSMDCEFLKGISPYDGKLSVNSCDFWLREQQYYAIFRRRNVHKVALIQSWPLKNDCSAQECPRFRWPKKSWQTSMLLTISSPIFLYLQFALTSRERIHWNFAWSFQLLPRTSKAMASRGSILGRQSAPSRASVFSSKSKVAPSCSN